MDGVRAWLRGKDKESPCGCETRVADDRLVLDAGDCNGAGKLGESPDCRETVVRALAGAEVSTVATRAAGVERLYAGSGGALLRAGGRFVERIRGHDERLANLACRDPLAAAREAVGRADAAAEIAAETGFAEVAAGIDGGYEDAFQPRTGPTVGHWRVSERVPERQLAETRSLGTGTEVRVHGSAEGGWRYHLRPAASRLNRTGSAAVADAADRLADPTRDLDTPWAAARAAAGEGGSTPAVATVLAKHTTGYGLLEDLFADPALRDAFVTAPVASNPVRVVVDGWAMRTNAWLTDRGAAALASRLRAESGRSFSRAAPTLDASIEIGGRRVRVAALRPPASDGLSFAFRAHDRDVWRLRDLVANGTVTTGAAAVLSLAVERGRSLLIAGPRGAGKTTTLAALLLELPSDVRTVLIEDTPELPNRALQAAGRDVQALYTGDDGGEIPPAEALRTALRLGDGALVVGEIRGEEASVLYEAMRVGANSEAVLGTVHGDGAGAVYDRVVGDLGVSPAAFGATDAVVTLAHGSDGRRVVAIEEVTAGDQPGFEPLYRSDGGMLRATGRIERGNSRLIADLAGPAESYGAVRRTLTERTERFDRYSPSDAGGRQ